MDRDKPKICKLGMLDCSFAGRTSDSPGHQEKCIMRFLSFEEHSSSAAHGRRVSRLHVYRCTGVQVYRCTGVQVYRCTAHGEESEQIACVEVYRSTGVQEYRCTGTGVQHMGGE